MLELSEPQLHALDENPDQAIELTDPRTMRTYVLVPSDVFEQMSWAWDDDIDMKQVGALVERNMKEDDAKDAAIENY